MLSNSEFIVMLNQAASDREKLGKLLNISNEQMSFITNAEYESTVTSSSPYHRRTPLDDPWTAAVPQ